MRISDWSSDVCSSDLPEIDELATSPGTALEHNLRALDDFRHLIASGDIACEERLPDGTIRPLPSSARRAFLADHGALLVLSREQSLWRCIPHRPQIGRASCREREGQYV